MTPALPAETLTPTPAPATERTQETETNPAESLPTPPKINPVPQAGPLPDTPLPPKRPTLDIHNTRHLAWILGAKLSLRAIPDSGTQEWEPGAVAEMLGLGAEAVAPVAGDKPGDLDAQVAALLKVAGQTGAQLTKKYGPDHAALLEMALKTNALAALYPGHPELAAPVAAAVEKAAVRAGVEAAMTRPLMQTLRSDPTPEELRQAVFAFQGVMEESLQNEARRRRNVVWPDWSATLTLFGCRPPPQAPQEFPPSAPPDGDGWSARPLRLRRLAACCCGWHSPAQSGNSCPPVLCSVGSAGWRRRRGSG